MTIDNSALTNSTLSTSTESALLNIEQVPAWNGNKEDKVVFSAIIAILVIATALLWLRHQENTVHSIVIPKAITQSLTELSNAAEEIIMMQSLEGLQPSLNELKELDIAPFAPERLTNKLDLHWQQFHHCFIATAPASAPPTAAKSSNNTPTQTRTHYQFRLLIDDSLGAEDLITYQIDWREFPAHSLLPTAKQNDCTTTAPSNKSGSTWHQFSNLNEENNTDVHAH